jgi:hypothetical protein
VVCGSCAGGANRLFSHYGNYACRFCHRAQYLSQKQKTARPCAKAKQTRFRKEIDIRTFAYHVS